MHPENALKVFVGSANPHLGKLVCDSLGIEVGQSEVLQFSDGNTFVRVLEDVRGRDTYIIQGVSYPVNQNFVELLFWLDALKLASAAKVTAIIPFFSYAKGDKKDEPQVSIRARVCADAIEAAGADHVLTMDLHSPQIQGFFHKPVDHIYARGIIAEYFKKRKIPDLVIASADVGFGKQAFKYGEMLSVPVVIGNKIRTDHSEKANIWNVVGDVKGKNVLIVDDIIFSGGSLIAMTEAVKAMGAKDVYAAVTHGVLTKGAMDKIQKSSIKELLVTDSVEYRFDAVGSKLNVVSVAPLFAEAIRTLHDYRKTSDIFG